MWALAGRARVEFLWTGSCRAPTSWSGGGGFRWFLAFSDNGFIVSPAYQMQSYQITKDLATNYWDRNKGMDFYLITVLYHAYQLLLFAWEYYTGPYFPLV